MTDVNLVILEYDNPFPQQTKTLIERALKIVFEGCDIQWVTDTRIEIRKMGLRNITTKRELSPKKFSVE